MNDDGFPGIKPYGLDAAPQDAEGRDVFGEAWEAFDDIWTDICLRLPTGELEEWYYSRLEVIEKALTTADPEGGEAAMTPQDAEGRDVLPEITACEETGFQAVAGTCPAHLGDACLAQYVHYGSAADPEGEPCERCGDRRYVFRGPPDKGVAYLRSDVDDIPPAYRAPCPDCGTPDESEGQEEGTGTVRWYPASEYGRRSE